MMLSRTWMLVAPLTLALAYGCGGDGGSSTTTDPTGAGAGAGNAFDADGDGISDVDEGAATNVDTDGDGIPDYQDADSDGDGIDDSIEAGDDDITTPPNDADGDGIPNFQDLDSDDNGIQDVDEGAEDPDGDGVGDFADLDNDGDGGTDVLEIEGTNMDCDGDGTADATGSAEAPADCDGDGIPNYLDVDSDNDTILDLNEDPTVDTDADGFYDRYDLDTDGDNFPDSQEAGDTDPSTAPFDTDGDLTPDFRDLDSDGDGLSDEAEFAAGTDPAAEDSDGDGVTDLIEVAAGTDPTDSADNPQAYGDFVFIVPFEQPTNPPDDILDFRTSVQFADVYFSIDRTGSMSQEVAALQTNIPSIINDLECDDTGNPCNIDSDCGTDEICFSGSGTCVEDPLTGNNGEGCVPDLWTGVGQFEDCNEYINRVPLQPDPQVTATSVGNITFSGATEAVVQTPACIADPGMYCSNNEQCSSDPSVMNPIGCPGYRPEAVRLLLTATDADNQGGTCGGDISSVAEAGGALLAAGIKHIGLYGSGDDGSGTLCTTPLNCMNGLGTESGTVDVNNNPFSYFALDAAIVQATRQAILEVVRGVPLNVTIEATDEPGDDGDALQFLDYLEVNVSGTGNCTDVNPTADTDGDTRDDAFPSLLGGTPVCWNVVPVQSQSTAPPTNEPQLFQARLTVFGDGSPLDARTVYFLVPPDGIVIPPPPK